MVSKTTMNIIIGILIFFLGVVLTIGFLTSHGTNNQENVMENSQSSNRNIYQDADWANATSNSALIFSNDTAQFTNAINNKDYYTAVTYIEQYRQDIETKIKSIDNFKVSPELKSCKDEYKLALLNDYNAATFMKSGITQLTSGNFVESAATAKMGTEELRLANNHYDNVTALMKIYNNAHPNSRLEVSFLYHNVGPEENSTNIVISTTEKTSMPATKTLADKESESDKPHASEDSNDAEDSSTSNIFDYCTWQAEITKKIGDYSEAPEGKSYVVVTI